MGKRVGRFVVVVHSCIINPLLRRFSFSQRLDRLERRLESLTDTVNLIIERLDVGLDKGDIPNTALRAPSSTPKSHRRASFSAPLGDIGDKQALEQGGAAGWWLTLLLIHEAWLLMQHANVLCNPYLQRLDRNYGIALRESSAPTKAP